MGTENTARDIQFQGFAEKLMNELLAQYGYTDSHGRWHLDIEGFRYMPGEGEIKASVDIIARRAYDLAVYVLNHVPITEYEPRIEDVPDMPYLQGQNQPE